jgi:hypothetical protein
MSRLLDAAGRYLADRKGLLPLIGLFLVVCNFLLRLLAPAAWLGSTDLLLHTGVVLAILGFLLARVL